MGPFWFGSIIPWGRFGWGRFGWGRFCEAETVTWIVLWGRSGWGRSGWGRFGWGLFGVGPFWPGFVNRWTKRVTRGLIGRVRSANICGGRKLHKYVSTNVWTMKNVSTQQMSRSVRYMTLQSGTVALRWLFSCWNKHGRLSRDQSPSGHVRSQAISCLANRSHHAYVLMH